MTARGSAIAVGLAMVALAAISLSSTSPSTRTMRVGQRYTVWGHVEPADLPDSSLPLQVGSVLLTRSGSRIIFRLNTTGAGETITFGRPLDLVVQGLPSGHRLIVDQLDELP